MKPRNLWERRIVGLAFSKMCGITPCRKPTGKAFEFSAACRLTFLYNLEPDIMRFSNLALVVATTLSGHSCHFVCMPI